MSQYRKNFGTLGETIAKNYLIKQDLTFLDSNFKIRGGEIDLIMQTTNPLEIVFVEVKIRKVDHIPLTNSISRSQQKSLIRTAKIWLNKKNLLNTVNWRIDFVGIKYKNQDDINIEWIPNAIF